MTKRRILDASSLSVPAPTLPDPAIERGKHGGVKPPATIGTMQRSTSPEQRQAHHKLKMRLKRMARAARYREGLSQEDGAGKA